MWIQARVCSVEILTQALYRADVRPNPYQESLIRMQVLVIPPKEAQDPKKYCSKQHIEENDIENPVTWRSFHACHEKRPLRPFAITGKAYSRSLDALFAQDSGKVSG